MSAPVAEGPRKRPIVRRCFVLCASTLWFFGLSFQAQGESPLTESAAVALGLSHPALQEVAQGRIGLAAAERERIRRWPNPVAAYQHEETDGRAGSSEDYAWISQTFDVAGRRHTRAKAAEHRVRAAHAEAESMLARRRATVRDHFYDALLAQERLAAFTKWLAQTSRIAEIIQRRAHAGEASGYDRRRFEREETTVRTRAATASAALSRARSQLVGLIGARDASGTPWTTLCGPLPPSSALPPLASLLAKLPERPDLRVLAEAKRAAELDHRASTRWWLPDLTVGAGVKTVEIDRDRLTGPFISASVPLPLLDQEQGSSEEAAAHLRVSGGEYELAFSAAEGGLQGLWTETAALTQAALDFRSNVVTPSTKLVGTAEQAYQAGEMELLGLIDAHQGALDAELEALELEMNARRAWIALARISGEDL